MIYKPAVLFTWVWWQSLTTTWNMLTVLTEWSRKASRTCAQVIGTTVWLRLTNRTICTLMIQAGVNTCQEIKRERLSFIGVVFIHLPERGWPVYLCQSIYGVIWYGRKTALQTKTIIIVIVISIVRGKILTVFTEPSVKARWTNAVVLITGTWITHTLSSVLAIVICTRVLLHYRHNNNIITGLIGIA